MNEKYIPPLILAVIAGAGSIFYNNTLTTARLAENIIAHSIAIEKIGANIEKLWVIVLLVLMVVNFIHVLTCF